MTRTLAFVALLAAPLAANAGETGKAPNDSPKPDGKPQEASSVQEMAFAAHLAEWGRDNGSPEALLAAAQVLADIPSVAHEANKTSKPIEGITQKDKDEEAAPNLNPEALQKEAQSYAVARGDKNLIKYVDTVVRTAIDGDHEKGPTKYTVTKVAGGFIDVFNITFTAGELAEIAVAGDGDTDLDLEIYDEFGNFIGSDSGATDNGYVSWTPRWTGNYRVEVKNHGNVFNQYLLITN
jgi:hypothetical protein